MDPALPAPRGFRYLVFDDSRAAVRADREGRRSVHRRDWMEPDKLDGRSRKGWIQSRGHGNARNWLGGPLGLPADASLAHTVCRLHPRAEAGADRRVSRGPPSMMARCSACSYGRAVALPCSYGRAARGRDVSGTVIGLDARPVAGFIISAESRSM